MVVDKPYRYQARPVTVEGWQIVTAPRVEGRVPEGVVTYTLRAPDKAGDHTLTAAFLYGTENAVTAGYFPRPSGRILFSEAYRIHIR